MYCSWRHHLNIKSKYDQGRRHLIQSHYIGMKTPHCTFQFQWQSSLISLWFLVCMEHGYGLRDDDKTKYIRQIVEFYIYFQRLAALKLKNNTRQFLSSDLLVHILRASTFMSEYAMFSYWSPLGGYGVGILTNIRASCSIRIHRQWRSTCDVWGWKV